MADRRKRGWVGSAGVLAAAVVAAACGGGGQGAVRPVPGWLLFPGEAVRVLWNGVVGGGDPRMRPGGQVTRYHPVGYSRPIPHVPIPQHPAMAANAGSNMHVDAYMSDAYEAPGPLGRNPRVASRSQGFGGYGTIAYDRARRLVAVYSDGRHFQLELMDPYTLEELASYDLPSRPWYWFLQGVMPWAYIGAGMYFYLDGDNRAVVPTTENTVEVVQVPEGRASTGFRLVRRFDLAEHVVPMSWPKHDSVAWVLPDWSGRYYWYATTQGMVGTVEVESGAVRSLRLEGELIENSFAVGEDGVFIVSDHALYRFSHDARGMVVTDWRTPYERGSAKKPGHISRGSGTSVTLAGGKDGVVMISDNAEPRIHLLFVRRTDGAVLCRVPVFAQGRSGTDVSVVGFEHAGRRGWGTGRYSAVIENNWGQHWFPVAHPAPGLARVDATRHGDGTFTCARVWTSREKGINVIKLSFASGLVYTYFRDDGDDVTQWYLSAVDFRTGATVYRERVGTGQGYNNWAGALFLHPDGGVLYTTTLFGLVMIRDMPGEGRHPARAPRG